MTERICQQVRQSATPNVTRCSGLQVPYPLQIAQSLLGQAVNALRASRLTHLFAEISEGVFGKAAHWALLPLRLRSQPFREVGAD